MAVDAASPIQLPEAELLHCLIQTGHDPATLQALAGLSSKEIFAVKGGLMSGLRTTSFLGSGWNGVLGSMAFDLVSFLTRADVRNSSTLEIRGDDTKVVTPHYMDALGVKLEGALARSSGRGA